VWLVEKLRGWSVCGGDLSRATHDEVATLLVVYWSTGTINSANRFCHDRGRPPGALGLGERVRAAAMALFPGDIDLPPRKWAKCAYHLRRYTL
jgi:hypothetical protein